MYVIDMFYFPYDIISYGFFLYINNQYCILQCTVYNNINYYFVYIQLCYFCLFVCFVTLLRTPGVLFAVFK